MPAARILGFAGSLRTGSVNVRLLQAAAGLAKDAGLEMTVADLRQYPMPIYDGDLEAKEGLPASVVAFKALMKAHPAFLLVCPEYNSSLSPLLKNVIDWASRSGPGEASLSSYQGKVAGLLSASPGALGGLRGLVPVRSILSNIGVLVLPEQVAIGKAHEAFDDAGRLRDAKQAASVGGLLRRLADVAGRLAS